MYDNRSGGSYDYSNSYMKKYLEEVVKVKMGVTSVSLPKWKGKDTITFSEIGSYDKSAIKYKKVTEYTKSVSDNYRHVRNITYTGSAEHDPRFAWTRTRWAHHSCALLNIMENGEFDNEEPNDIFGLRPVIEY